MTRTAFSTPPVAGVKSLKMQTDFDIRQLADPDIAAANDILRKCVHCGFCLATCPTYVLTGDERDSPRGRIYMIKNMLEEERPATKEIVPHIDQCLSCLACETTCPSGVSYRKLIDRARVHVEETYDRPWIDKALRLLIKQTVAYPKRFKAAIILANMTRPLRALLPKALTPFFDIAPRTLKPSTRLTGKRLEEAIGTVTLHPGCAQQALAPEINAAAGRVLARFGFSVRWADPDTCCGSLAHHMGDEKQAKNLARDFVDRLSGRTDPLLFTVSGCGNTAKEMGGLVEGGGEVAAQANDISEFLLKQLAHMPKSTLQKSVRVVWQAPCTLTHGQKRTDDVPTLLRAAGFDVTEPFEQHLCCGSAGSYNLLQPDLSDQLLDRKMENINTLAPEIIATANIGCLMQLRRKSSVPVVHVIELLDWATGGEKPF